MKASVTTRTSRRRLHLPRLLAVVAIAAGGFAVLRQSVSTKADDAPSTWFTPYVDVTLTPSYPFGDTRYNPSDAAVLGFVVASPDSPCVATWGGYYTPDEAVTGIDLDRRIATLRARGGEAIVSFGGAVNSELADACDDPEALVAAYSGVLDRYQATTADFDIEGAALGDRAANQRRAAAVAEVQRGAGGTLSVWLTLPVATDGLTADGIATVDDFLAAGVDLAGVNVMTMNYNTVDADAVMSEVAVTALEATAKQVQASFGAAGIDLSGADLWNRIGATVMIGRNDVRLEVFTLDDAQRLAVFADSHDLGRLALWSLNRDAPCGPELDSGIAQNICSGVDQEPLAFSNVFASAVPASAPTADTVVVDPAASRGGVVVDDPATAPYPIWQSGRSYEAEDKAVWRGNVYQAKWWNENTQPDAPATNPWDSPWSLVGPVLPTDRPAPTTTIPDGTFPEWDVTTGYPAGTKIQHDGAAYEAKWYSTGQEPGADISNPWDTPWAPFAVPADTDGSNR